MSYIAGFQTKNGDLYRFDQHTGVSKRMQLAAGPDQGKASPDAACLFIRPMTVDQIHREKRAGRQIFFGYREPAIPSIEGFENEVVMPPGKQAVVVALDPKTGSVAKDFDALVIPQLSATPVERHAFPNGTEYVHIGAAITKLYSSSSEFKTDLCQGIADALGEPLTSRRVLTKMIAFSPPAPLPPATTTPLTPMHRHSRVVTPRPGGH